MFLNAVRLRKLILYTVILGFGVPFGQAAEVGPVLEIPAARHDAGTKWEGEKVLHAFEVVNRGTAELKIRRVKPG